MDFQFRDFLLYAFFGMTLQYEIVVNDTKQSWFMAYEFCKHEGARMLTKSDLQLDGLIQSPEKVLEGTFWLGSYTARTDFLTELGTYSLKETDIQIIKGRKVINAPTCFFHCIQDKNVSAFFIAIHGNNCYCIPEETFSEDANAATSCHKSNSEESNATHNTSYTLYRIERSLKYDVSAGFCAETRHPFIKMYISSCSKKHSYYCKGVKDGNFLYRLHAKEKYWRQSRSECLNCSKYNLLADIADYSMILKNITKRRAYWVSTRIYTTHLVSDEILVDQKYIYRCDVWDGTKIRDRFGCVKRKRQVACIKDNDNSQTRRTTGGIQIIEPSSTNGHSFYISYIVVCTLFGFILLL